MGRDWKKGSKADQDTTVEVVETIKTIMDHQVLVVDLDILDTLVYRMHQHQEQI